MKTIIVNIKKLTVTTNGQTCNFQEAGLNENFGKFNPLTDKDEIEEALTDYNEGEEIEVIFDGESIKKLDGQFYPFNLSELLKSMEFDKEDTNDIEKITEINTPIIEANSENGQSIYLTFLGASNSYCILNHEKNEDIVNKTIEDILPLIISTED